MEAIFHINEKLQIKSEEAHIVPAFFTQIYPKGYRDNFTGGHFILLHTKRYQSINFNP